MDIKLISKELQQDLYSVIFTEIEVDVLYRYINYEKHGINLVEGTNLLQKDILWFLLSELRGVSNFPYRIGDELMQKLKDCLYPEMLK